MHSNFQAVQGELTKEDACMLPIPTYTYIYTYVNTH